MRILKFSRHFSRYGSVATFNPKNSRLKFFCKRDEDFFSTWKPCDIYRKKTQLTSKGISGGGKRHRGRMNGFEDRSWSATYSSWPTQSHNVLFFHQISFPRFFSRRGTSKVLKGIHTHLFVSSWPTETQLNLTLWTISHQILFLNFDTNFPGMHWQPIKRQWCCNLFKIYLDFAQMLVVLLQWLEVVFDCGTVGWLDSSASASASLHATLQPCATPVFCTFPFNGPIHCLSWGHNTSFQDSESAENLTQNSQIIAKSYPGPVFAYKYMQILDAFLSFE